MTMSIFRPVAVILAGVLALAPPTTAAFAQSIKVQHARGEIELPAVPKKVLVFDLAALDTLDALGVEVAGVPTARLPDYLSKFNADRYEKVGTLFEPNYEAVNAAAPDLIIVGGRSAAVLPQLAEIAPTIDLSTDAADYLGSIEENARTLGEIFGKEDEVDALVTDLDESIAGLREEVSGVGTGLIVLTSGGEVTAYGPGSRFGWLHDELGITPAREDIEVGSHGQPISFEYIRETNPDWLFVVDRDAAIGEGGAAAEQVLDNELVAQTTAWTQDQVVYVDAVDWYIAGGGLATMQRIVDDVADAVTQA